MKKLICILFSVIMCLTVLTACGGKNNNNGGVTVDGEGNVTGTLTIWGGAAPFHDNYAVGSIEGSNYDPDCDTTQTLLNKIKAKYPKLNIVIENKGNSTDLNTSLRNAKISNNMPDIVIGEQFIKSQIELDYFVPLTIPEETKNAIPDYLWEQSKGADGKQYGYPAFTGCFGLVYNKKIFREVYSLKESDDVTPYVPTTMDDIVKVAAKVKEFYNNKYGASSVQARNMSGFLLNAVAGVGSAYRNGLVMSMFGGGFTDEKGDFIVNSEANVKAFEWLTSLLPYTSTGNIATTNETDINTTILNGNVAMTFEIAPLLAPFGGVSVDDFGVAPLPIVDGESSANILVGSTSYMITKECANKEVAQDILEMMVSYDTQMGLYKKSTNRIPVRNDVITEILASEDEEILKKSEIMGPYILAMKTTENMVQGLPSFTTNYSNIWKTWTTAIQYIYTQPSKDTIVAQLGNVQSAMSK